MLLSRCKRVFSREEEIVFLRILAIRIEQQQKHTVLLKGETSTSTIPSPTHKRRKDLAHGDDGVVGLSGAPFMACELLITLTIYEL